MEYTPSTRQPKRLCDDDTRVGRAARTFGLGYKPHLSIDFQNMLPLTSPLSSANQNEKKHSSDILEETKNILKRCGANLRSVIADSQYSDSKLRRAVDETVACAKKFRNYEAEDQKKGYHKRPYIEAAHNFLKTQYSLAINKARDLRNVAAYALYSLLCLVLNREAAENIEDSTRQRGFF